MELSPMAEFVALFYGGAIADRGYPVRLEALTVYDLQHLSTLSGLPLTTCYEFALRGKSYSSVSSRFSSGTNFARPSADHIAHDGAKTCETKLWVYVTLDNIEHKVVPAAERPRRQTEKHGGVPGRTLDQQNRRCQHADDEEEISLDQDSGHIREIVRQAHGQKNARNRLAITGRRRTCPVPIRR